MVILKIIPQLPHLTSIFDKKCLCAINTYEKTLVHSVILKIIPQLPSLGSNFETHKKVSDNFNSHISVLYNLVVYILEFEDI